MPLYEYVCTHCSQDYTVLRPMAERNAPSFCPTCSSEGVKMVLTAPRTSVMSKNSRIAHETNEKSQHAPKTLEQYKAKHGSGCSCCSSSRKTQSPSSEQTAYKAGGSRPWMISH